MRSAQSSAATANGRAPEAPAIVCLCCGEERVPSHTPSGLVDGGECARCGYSGWVRAGEIDPAARRELAVTGIVLPV